MGCRSRPSRPVAQGGRDGQGEGPSARGYREPGSHHWGPLPRQGVLRRPEGQEEDPVLDRPPAARPGTVGAQGPGVVTGSRVRGAARNVGEGSREGTRDTEVPRHTAPRLTGGAPVRDTGASPPADVEACVRKPGRVAARARVVGAPVPKRTLRESGWHSWSRSLSLGRSGGRPLRSCCRPKTQPLAYRHR